MKTLFIAGCALVAAFALSGCTTANSTALAPITNAVAAQIPHCHIGGSLNAGVGGIAGTGSGLTQTLTFDCLAAPYPAPDAPAAAPQAAPAPSK
jgi:hypothetical protein